MNWVDWIFAIIVGGCVLQGVLKGTLSQAFMLLRITLAMVIAIVVQVAWIPQSFIDNQLLVSPSIMYAVSLFILYVLAWLALFLLFIFVRMIFPLSGNIDFGQRAGGAILAFLRGVIVLLLVILLIDYTPLSSSRVWHSSAVRSYLAPVVEQIREGFILADTMTSNNINRFLPVQSDISDSVRSSSD